ncbi:MAG TPA: mercury(II) reductase [Nitrolancea sp.]|nr:mercury(II) reductase [Nitrolancea sp.]
MSTEYTMAVNGMTCDHCEVTVREALENAGAQQVQASYRRGDARFRVSVDTDLARLSTAIHAAGYQPGAITPVQSAVDLPRPRSGSSAYDLAIIGSGSAAFAAAITARDLGARVVMIERSTLGGTCVNIGCVPSKRLLRAAEMFHDAGHHPFAGIETRTGAVDFGALVTQKDDLVAHLRQQKYADLIDVYGWELIQGEARFVDGPALVVAGRTITADAYLIATGARPAVPPIPGLAEAGYLTSTTAMELDRLPSSLAIIGAGYIALEQGQIFRHLGSAVTIMQRGPRLLPDYEPEVAEAAHQMLDRLGTQVLTGSQIQRVERTAQGRQLLISREGRMETIEAEQILVATGRQPNTDVLNLEQIGVELDSRGAPVVDEHLRTTNQRIFAAGDVTLAPQFVYVAAYQGRLAAKNALTVTPRPVDFRAVPSVIFTEPQIASVGLTRAQAEGAGFVVKSTVLPIGAVPRAQVNVETEGIFTMVVEAATKRLLGVQVVADNAGDVIYAATLAVKYGLTVTDLVESFAPYLTMAEGLKLGALSFGRDVAKLSCCAA